MTDFCRMVRRAGGVPVLAHPGYLYERNPDGFTIGALDISLSMLDLRGIL